MATPSEALSSSALPASLSTSSFYRARVASLVSVFPLGAWVVVHLWHNLAAFQGAQAWQEAVTVYPHPAAQLFSLVVVSLPLLFHTVWGLQRLVSARPNNLAYRGYGNFKYLVQRLAAVGVLLFLGAHVWRAFLRPHLVQGHAEWFTDIAYDLAHNGPTLPVYLLGTLGVAYHLANGLSTFCWSWGFVSGRTAVKRMDRMAILVFGVLLAMAWGSLYALFHAGLSLPPPSPES